MIYLVSCQHHSITTNLIMANYSPTNIKVHCMNNYKLRAAVLSATLLLSGCSSQTSDANKAKVEAHKQSICTSITSVAENIMKTRLDGATIQNVLKATDNIDGSDPMDAALKVRAKEMIIEAYRQPDYMTNEHKERAIREFGSKQYIKCVDDGFAKNLAQS